MQVLTMMRVTTATHLMAMLYYTKKLKLIMGPCMMEGNAPWTQIKSGMLADSTK
jgi:hypothetical protein